MITNIISNIQDFFSTKILSAQQKDDSKILSIIEHDLGHFNSFKSKRSLLTNNEEVPWFTYPAIEYLNNLSFKNKNVFEFGSGDGSLYWARRSKSVVSVEFDKEWYKKNFSRRLANQKVIYSNIKSEYQSSIVKTNRKYDIIIIDGIYRLGCAKNSVRCLEKGGFIILDNSDWYQETASYLRKTGFQQIDFSGFGPINYYCWKTSIFINRDSKIPYIEKKTGFVVGGLKIKPKDEK